MVLCHIARRWYSIHIKDSAIKKVIIHCLYFFRFPLNEYVCYATVFALVSKKKLSSIRLMVYQQMLLMSVKVPSKYLLDLF